MDTIVSHKFGLQVKVGRNVFSRSPKVSIVIPAYNVSAFIAETLESAINQEYRDYEIIVVNDGSPDTRQFEKAIGPYLQNIIYIKQPSKGAGAARNTAIEHARGELIAFLDGDDIWLPEFLASQVAFMGTDYDMVYCDAFQFGMRSVLGTTFMQTAPSEGVVDAKALLEYSCNVITSGTVATKAALEHAELFEPEPTKAHDFHLWVRMAKTGARIGYQKLPLLNYRVHLSSLSGNSVTRIEREIDVMERIKRTVVLDDVEMAIVDRQLSRLHADLQIEFGKSFLINEEFESAYKAFAEANRQRRSPKLTAITFLARFAPHRLLKHYRDHRTDEIAFVPVRLPTSIDRSK